MDKKSDTLLGGQFIIITTIWNIVTIAFVVLLEWWANGSSGVFSLIWIAFSLTLFLIFYSLVILKKLESRLNIPTIIGLGIGLFFGLLWIPYILLPGIIIYILIYLKKKENFKKGLQDWCILIGVTVLGYIVDFILAILFVQFIFDR